MNNDALCCPSDGLCVVTGATGGIGSAIVDGLVESGAKHIVLAVRNVDAGMKLAANYTGIDCEIIVMRCDLSDFAQLHSFAGEVLKLDKPIWALINNAGMLASRKCITVDGYEATMQINWLAPLYLTRLLTPAMGSGGRILFTTSFMRRVCRVNWCWQSLSVERFNRFRVYSWSKLMLAQVAREIAVALRPKGIMVNCTDPGIVDTKILRLGNRVVDTLADFLLRPLIRTPRQGAEATFRALASDSTGQVFTRHGNKPIAVRDSRHLSVTAAETAINKAEDLLNSKILVN